MKFSCGKTPEVKWEEYRVKARLTMAKLKLWRRWFAWRPVTIDEQDGRKICVWLQWVECRVKPDTPYTVCGLLSSTDWEYRLPETERN
jgi:hypothetical protein